jgi:hypothetical protein
VYWSAGDARSNDQSFGLDEFPSIFSEEMQQPTPEFLRCSMTAMNYLLWQIA